MKPKETWGDNSRVSGIMGNILVLCRDIGLYRGYMGIVVGYIYIYILGLYGDNGKTMETAIVYWVI